jgi:hypothetical protein
MLRALTILSMTALAGVLAGAQTTLTIAVPYAGAERLTTYWAVAEEKIDWQRGGSEAERCTVAFAATELQNFLARTAPTWKFRFAQSAPAEGPVVTLGIDRSIKDPQAYVIRSGKRGLEIKGGGREGVLYGVYAWLGELGWRWYAANKNGEVAPEPRESLKLDGWKIESAPDFPMFRGFHAATESMESAELFLWMARNRLNAWAYRPRTYALMKKLGFRFLSGGHILEDILNPDAPQPSGKSLFEAHPDWFPEIDGKRERKNADRYQFCVTNQEASNYVAQKVVEKLRTDWCWTDFQNVWMLDTWAGWCQCAKCRALGNDADRYLHFLSVVRSAVNAAIARGELKRNTGMALAAYEGTPALEGPLHGVPKNLTGSSDFALYAPINRCYVHKLEDNRCTEMNTHYARAVESWGKVSKQFPLAVVEYYNVSKFEDLPLLFSRTMGEDFAYYKRTGVTGMSYMHIPMALWGPRTLTQALVARLAWDSQASVGKIKDEYLKLYYGPAAETMGEFYDSLEAAYSNITAWRSWFRPSVNHELLKWKADRPTKPLFTLRHLPPEGGEGIGPAESLALLDKAGAALRRARAMKTPVAVQLRMEEDARLFRYGDDSFRFYWALAQVYEAERTGDEGARKVAWAEVERRAESLVSYYMPFDFDYPAPGVNAKDALTRTQLRGLIDQLREKYGKP